MVLLVLCITEQESLLRQKHLQRGRCNAEIITVVCTYISTVIS